MSRLIFNRHSLARLYHTSHNSSQTSTNVSRERKATLPAKVASKRYSLPQKRANYEAQPLPSNHDPRRKFEPFPFAVTEENKLDIIKRVVTPLHDTPYEEQLASKESLCRNSLRSLAQELYQSGTPVRLDVRRLPCQVNNIVRSLKLNKYRNRDEFTIWYGHDGKTITAGHNVFPIGRHGDTVSVEPDGVPIIKDEVIRLAGIIQEFLRVQAKSGVCFSLGAQGGWRRFQINSNLHGDLMLTGILNPTELKVREVIDDRDNFRDFMVRRCQEEGLNLVSLYYQPCPNNYCRHESVPYELLHGEKRLLETIGGHKFLISPDSFTFQSTLGAEALLDTIRKTINDCFLDINRDESDDNGAGVAGQSKPIILDTRSSFGLFSLALSDMAKLVIGVEDKAMAVDDAQSNAELNGISNCVFINSNLEIVLERIIEKYCSKGRQEMLALIDMPPSGVHKSVLEVIKRCANIKKIVVISSKVDSARTAQSIVNLCQKEGSRSLAPFAPILATPVDICPQTESFCTVLALERIPQ